MFSHFFQHLSFFAIVVPVTTGSFIPAEKINTEITPQQVQQSAYVAQFEQGEIRIPIFGITDATHLKVYDIGPVIKGVSTNQKIPKGYRSSQHVYEYHFSTNISKKIDLIMHYIPHGKDLEKKQIFYRADESQPWKKLRTVTQKSDQTVHAFLPAPSGQIVFAKSIKKKEGPIKHTHFVPYGALPHSDTGAVLDAKSGKFLFREEAKKQRPIASLTKVTSVLTFLATKPNVDTVVTYSNRYERDGATVGVNNGEQLSLKDVLMGTLLPSANNMAEMLAQSTSMSREEFIAKTNQCMKKLSLHQTQIVEPSGLDQKNVSSAGNYARIARYAFNTYPEIFSEAATTQQYSFSTKNTGRGITIYSTNKFDGRGVYEATAFKTGYYPGYAERTLAIKIRERSTGHEVIVVLFGNKEFGTILEEAYTLAQWAFNNYEFH